MNNKDLNKLSKDELIKEINLLRSSNSFEILENYCSEMIHEVKNSLTVSILSFSILKGKVDLTDSVIAREVEKIEACHSNMKAIIELEHTLTQNNETEEDVDLNDLIHINMRVLRGMFKEKNISTELNLDEKLIALKLNKFFVSQVLTNLLFNAIDAIAIKENNKGLIIVTTKLLDDKVILEIEDNGIGIKEDQISNVFDKNFSTKKNSLNKGLGLSIVSKYISAMNGKVDVTSKVGQGSKFIVTFVL
jgi:signal transduction histidine kinase